MVQLGYKLSSEEHRPNDLVRYARLAEESGFTFATQRRGAPGPPAWPPSWATASSAPHRSAS